MNPSKQTVDMLIRSMNNNPEQWEFTEYRAMNTTINYSIWTCGGCCALHIDRVDPEYKYRSWENPYWSVDNINVFGWFVPWRRRLLGTALALKNKKLSPNMEFYT